MIRRLVGPFALLLALGACVAAGPQPAPAAASPSIPIALMKPEGSGPFAGVVILHDCSGLGPRSSGAPRRWAKTLVDQGYAVAMPDSFATRGFENGVCTDAAKDRARVGPARRVADAYEALAYLRAQPYVDGAHVGVMGGSHGGATTLLVMKAPRADGFAAGIALYPSCNGIAPYHATAPLLILAGELDDWTPAPICERLARAARGAAVRIKVYPNARHSFDSANPKRYVANRNNMNAPGGKGATTEGNAEAWADSIREVTAFFRAHLGSR